MTDVEILRAALLADVDKLRAELQAQRETLRDKFAMAALQGCLAYSYVNPSHGNFHENCNPAFVAASAYDYADAMLAERNRHTVM